MSLLQNSNAISTGGGYNLESSLRFRLSAGGYLSRTPTSASNRTTWTWSGWVKIGTIATTQILFAGGQDANNYTNIYFTGAASGNLELFTANGGANSGYYYTTSLFRDPSAWYHIVYSVDTTAATKVTIYVNGVAQPLTINTAMSSSYNTWINSANEHRLGRNAGTNTNYFDGYMTEVNFVDGQALTPSDFGETDTTTGVWKPKEYTGTYGTNGFYLPFTEKTDFKSFDLDGTGDYISAPASEYSNYINGSGDFTIEWWANYDALPSDAGWYAQDSGSAVVSPFNLFQQSNSWRLYATTANGAWNVFSNTLLATTSLTTGRWYHIACVRNGSTLTLYVNGVSQGSQTIGTASLWTDTSHNLSLFNDWQSAGGGGGFNGRVSNYRLVKGTAVYTGNFTPPTANLENISGTTILLARSTSTADLSGNITTTANGNLSLSDNNPPLSSGIGDDTSGNDNHWASNNIDLTSNATTYDIMNDVATLTDEDTGNFATWNPLDKAVNYNTSNGNLSANTASAYATHKLIRTTHGITSGKYYWELNVNNSANIDIVGLSPINYNGTRDTFVGGHSDSAGWGYSTSSGIFYNGTNWTTSGTASGFPASGIVGVAFDADNGKLYFSKNGVWFNSADPSAGTGATHTYTGSETGFVPALSMYSNTGSWTINFGQRPFAYTPPTGYKKLNTYNLPDSTIVDGSQYMNTKLWTGNGTNQDIDVGWNPDLVWYRNRTDASGGVWTDSIRGDDLHLQTTNTNAEGAFANMEFITNGYNVSGNSNLDNISGRAFVGWHWRGSDSSPVSNTDGTITSTVSANTDSGFSVVTYVGTAAIATVGHGLGVAPSMIITKNRDTTTAWWVYHAALGNTKYVVLNTTAAAVTSSVAWNNTSPTSTVFTLGGAGNPSNANQDVAYCFADVEGFSKFGSYTGNGSADGPFVYTGFRPKFVMYKLTSGAGSWVILDTSRTTYNVTDKYLLTDAVSAEGTFTTIDILSNGFKVRNSDPSNNPNGGTVIYMAFAENPFKQSLAR